MSIDIIMRSKNERPILDRTLEALYQQSVKNFTLSVIDSGSTDGSQELIARYTSNLDHICPEEYLPGKVLNRMIEKTKEPIIVFLNADAVPIKSDWLENLIRPLQQGIADAAMSRQVPRENARFIVAYDMHRAYCKDVIAKQPYFFSAVSCAFTRSLWEKTKFLEYGFSEDMDWCKKCKSQGARVLFVPESVVEHSHNYTLQEWYNRGVIEGEGEARILGKKASITKQSFACFKEIVRDLLFTVSKGKLHTIPYNICYRIVGHAGMYQGKKIGKIY